ncbi:MAG: arsenite methyltransferase [Candidatus Methanosuratincola sp.]|jgi:ubiquinone/menaquinone biosynthesis C-methylase UbiE|nr:arsenite methyltransferase [Candidatus Methanosuratincola sp.]
MRRNIKDLVRKKYAKIATSGGSCCPSCGCGGGNRGVQVGGYSEGDLVMAPPESSMGLGCGNPVAYAGIKPGEVVLDLGSGGGMDAFLAARKAGPDGRVIGVDMTDAMLDRAREAAIRHGFRNVEFRKGDMEAIPLEDSSVDVVISNCAINLSTDKARVFKEINRVLKPGGRIVVSDIVTKGDLPEHVKRSPEAWASCIAGALEKREYLRLISESGLEATRILAESGYSEGSPEEIAGKLASITVYAVKPRE